MTELHVPLADLRHALVAPAAAAARRAEHLPALTCLLLQSPAGTPRLTVAGSDNAVSAWWSCPAGETPLRALVPAADFLGAIKGLGAGADDVRLEHDGDVLVVRHERTVHRLPTYPVDDHPSVHVVPPTPADDARFDAAELRDGLARAAVTMAGDDTRPHLSLVAVRVGDGATDGWTLAATDGHRASRMRLRAAGSCKADLPRRVVEAALRALPDRPDVATDARIGATERAVYVAVGEGGMVWGNTSADTPPPLHKVFPGESRAHALTASRDAWLAAIKRVEGAARSSVGDMIDVTFGAGGATLRAGRHDLRQASDFVEGEVDGDNVRFGASARYLREAIDACPGDRVTVGTSGAVEPISVRPEAGDAYDAVVMPVRLS